jgi:hypothetical protein
MSGATEESEAGSERRSLKEEESRRGERPGGRLNTGLRRTHRFAEQRLEAEAHACGGRATGQHAGDNGKGATTGEEPARLRVGRKPWTDQTLYVAAG